MLKLYNSSYKYNNVDIIASVMLKLIDMPLCTIRVFICIQTSNVDGLDAEDSSPVNVVKI